MRYGRGVRRTARRAPGPISGPGRERGALVLAAWIGSALVGCQFDPTGTPGAGSDASDGIGGGGAEADGAPRADARVDPPDAAPEPVVCTPGATTCEGRVMSTCNAAGDGFDARVPCALTCEGDDHCTLASNVPEPDQLACTGAAPRLAPAADATVVLGADGAITCAPHCGDVETTSIAAAGTRDQGGGANLRWYCVSELTIPDGLTVTAEVQASSIAILVAGDASIAGTLSVDGAAGTPTTAGAGGPGGGSGGDLSGGTGRPGTGSCPGQGGQSVGGIGSSAGGGGAGAGFGSGGAAGGDGRTPGSGQSAPGGIPVGNCGEEDLDPLVGGGGGGGAGGAILLEASAIAVGGGSLVVEGGDGALSGAGNGGGGARADQAAGEGADATANGQGGGGGGGGGGRVRLNASAAPACAGAASPAAACTAAGLRQAGTIAGRHGSAR